ncbi:antitoxin VbhA family protein [Pseudomonas aeruginosa]|uniref:antitoxin VbhA family protein n=1 Tax=Pseudomonas aeruginosa TaxID=287 RepID=UPI00336C2FC2
MNPSRQVENLEQALASVRLSGVKPSRYALELFDKYRKGEIEISEVVLALKAHYSGGRI